MKTLLVNFAWYCSNLPGYIAYKRGIRNVKRTQMQRLLKLVRTARETKFGLKHDFASINSLEDFRERVPVSEYQDFELYIDEIAAGKPDVLFPGHPWCFEPTSGTSSTNKLIPYNRALHQEFQAGIAPWIFSMFTHNPGLMKGSAYWSISPVKHQKRFTTSGIPIGFQDDTVYLNYVMRHAMKYVMAVPGDIAASDTIDDFYLHTMRHLVLADNLALISIWNPSFLSILLDILKRNKTLFIKEIESIDHERAKKSENMSYSEIWPQLKVISCWADGAATVSAKQLKDLFPGVKLIPKGLIATEGFISFPIEGLAAHALAINSHFYEFIPLNHSDRILSAWELELGCRYSVVITTGGGLYRYKLHDIIQVEGFYHQCPLLKFIGRDNTTSDICGEKLHEELVIECLQEVFTSASPGFALLAPEKNTGDSPFHYVLYVTDCNQFSATELENKQQQFEQLLCRNYHYAYCRELKQLDAVKFAVLNISKERAMKYYLDESTVYGQKLGDIKPTVLSNKSGWDKIFAGLLR